jgi:hypothetical protein
VMDMHNAFQEGDVRAAPDRTEAVGERQVAQRRL